MRTYIIYIYIYFFLHNFILYIVTEAALLPVGSAYRKVYYIVLLYIYTHAEQHNYLRAIFFNFSHCYIAVVYYIIVSGILYSLHRAYRVYASTIGHKK